MTGYWSWKRRLKSTGLDDAKQDKKNKNKNPRSSCFVFESHCLILFKKLFQFLTPDRQIQRCDKSQPLTLQGSLCDIKLCSLLCSCSGRSLKDVFSSRSVIWTVAIRKQSQVQLQSSCPDCRGSLWKWTEMKDAFSTCMPMSRLGAEMSSSCPKNPNQSIPTIYLSHTQPHCSRADVLGVGEQPAESWATGSSTSGWKTLKLDNVSDSSSWPSASAVPSPCTFISKSTNFDHKISFGETEMHVNIGFYCKGWWIQTLK